MFSGAPSLLSIVRMALSSRQRDFRRLTSVFDEVNASRRRSTSFVSRSAGDVCEAVRSVSVAARSRMVTMGHCWDVSYSTTRKHSQPKTFVELTKCQHTTHRCPNAGEFALVPQGSLELARVSLPPASVWVRTCVGLLSWF